MHKIYWRVVVLQLADIAIRNVGEHYLTQKMKYIMIRLDN